MDLEEIMRDPGVRDFTKEILRKCGTLDPVDALGDVMLAAVTWKGQVDRALGSQEQCMTADSCKSCTPYQQSACLRAEELARAMTELTGKFR